MLRRLSLMTAQKRSYPTTASIIAEHPEFVKCLREYAATTERLPLLVRKVMKYINRNSTSDQEEAITALYEESYGVPEGLLERWQWAYSWDKPEFTKRCEVLGYMAEINRLVYPFSAPYAFFAQGIVRNVDTPEANSPAHRYTPYGMNAEYSVGLEKLGTYFGDQGPIDHVWTGYVNPGHDGGCSMLSGAELFYHPGTYSRLFVQTDSESFEHPESLRVAVAIVDEPGIPAAPYQAATLLANFAKMVFAVKPTTQIAKRAQSFGVQLVEGLLKVESGKLEMIGFDPSAHAAHKLLCVIPVNVEPDIGGIVATLLRFQARQSPPKPSRLAECLMKRKAPECYPNAAIDNLNILKSGKPERPISDCEAAKRYYNAKSNVKRMVSEIFPSL